MKQPAQALKFIILKHDDQYMWEFADNPECSHLHLYKNLSSVIWKPVAGGFYCFKVGNAITKTMLSYIETDQSVLELFGSSDFYGMSKDIYNAAKPFLIKQIGSNITIKEQLFLL